MKTYLATYLGALLGALALTPLVIRAALRLGLVDHPGARKVHATPVPRVGGIAIFLATFLALIPAAMYLLRVPSGVAAPGGGAGPLWVLMALGAGVFLVGLADDVLDVPSKFKLLALAAAAATACYFDFAPRTLHLLPAYAVELGPWSWPLAMTWILGVTVAVNFIDGLDGLAAGIGVIVCGTVAAVAFLGGQPAVMLVALALLGALCGFLAFNFNPARVFMGDCGSMFLGFTLATLSLLCARKTGMTAGVALPGLALGIPLLDAAVTMVRRGVLQRRSLFAAERGHVHHRLIDLGLRHRTAVLTLYAVTLACVGVGLVTLFCHDALPRVLCSSAAPLMLLAFFGAVGSLRVGEISAALRRNWTAWRLTSAYRRHYDDLQLRLARVRTFDGWWDEVCRALARFDAVRLDLALANRDGSARHLRWERQGAPAAGEGLTVSATVPVRQRRVGGPAWAQLDVSAEGSLELAGRRVTFLGRLLEDHSLASLPDVGRPADSPAAGGPAGASSPAGLERAAGEAEPAPSPLGPAVRVAVVHDFLYTYAGAERVLEQILRVFPDATLFSLFDFLPADKRGFLRGKAVRSSFIQRLPMARRRHRAYLPLMPLAIEQLDVSAFDVVISSSYVAAKGVLTRPDQLHVCYCHSPVRFAWDLQHQYLTESGLTRGLKSMLARAVLHYIRNWDARSANSVDAFVTNSDFVARRISKFYRRRSTTVYPPVDVGQFTPGGDGGREDFYLTASRLVPYKRVDLIVEAFSAMPGRRLIVVGDGPDLEKIRLKAGPNVKLVGHQPFEKLLMFMRRARAFVFAAEEDFGIVPVEAQACGTPVIAFGRGGVTESIADGQTGVLFPEQTPPSLVAAVERFEREGVSCDAAEIRANAERFNPERFRLEFGDLVRREWDAFRDVPAAASAGGVDEASFGQPRLHLSLHLARQARALAARVSAAERQSAAV